MSRRSQFSLRALLVMVVLFAIAFTSINAVGNDNRMPGPTAFFLVEVCGACIGAAVGVTANRPWLFGGIGAALVLPVLLAARLLLGY